MLAFIPLTHSVFWGSMAYVLIGGTAVGTVLTLAFLPALYAIWFRVSDADAVRSNHGQQAPPVAELIYEHADEGHPTVRAHHQRLTLPKTSELLDDAWLRQLCLDAIETLEWKT